MDRSLLVAALAIAAVGIAGLLLRAGSTRDPIVPPPGADADPPDAGPSGADADEAEWEELEGMPGPGELLAVTSEGDVFIPHRHGARVLPLGEARAAVAAGVASWDDLKRQVLEASRASGGIPGTALDPGDFTAGRVVRGAPSVDPWRLELLGPDGEFVPYAFETEEAARVALALLERTGVIRRRRGEDGEALPPSPGDFAEARRRYDETIEALAMTPEEPPEEPR